MEITVCSTLDGRLSGYIVFKLSPKFKIDDLLKLYCTEKGIEAFDNYALHGKGNTVLYPSKSLSEEGITDGDTVYLSQTDDKEQLFAFGSWWVIILVALLIGGCGLAYSLYMFCFAPGLPHKYGLVIDAGSTHSELFVFSWREAVVESEPEVELIHNCVMYGGVAEFRTHVDDLHEYFNICISEAQNVIPAAHVRNTPLILAATAGMRILRAYDPEGAKLVISSAREVLRTRTNFKISHHDVFVASGQQEGINGWAALNYLMETFQETDNDDDPAASALDLGGASVQVTTEVVKDDSYWPSINITIFNNTYRIFSKSFLCYGVGEAMHRYQYFLINHLHRKSDYRVVNPCLPKGFEVSFTRQDYTNPCILSNRTGDLHSLRPTSFNPTSRYTQRFRAKYLNIIGDYGLDEDLYGIYSSYGGVNNTEENEHKTRQDDILHLLEGESDVKLCRKRVRDLFNYKLCKENFVFGDCLNKELVPSYTGELVGFSSIFRRLLPLLGIGREGSSLEDFKKAVLLTCSKSAKDLIHSHPNVSKSMLEDLCFDGMYVYTLLSEGLGITPRKWKNILFTNKIHEQEVVWALGLMLNRTFSTYRFRPRKGVSLNLTSFCLLVFMFSAFLLIAISFVCFIRNMRRSGNRYQRVPIANL